jgi:large conductance mechanosensitive channel
MLKEFRDFAMKGNVVDLAVAVIIGAAFGKIVDSLVGDIIMPIIGAITGGLDFSNYYLSLSSKVQAGLAYVDAKKAGAVLGWGQFLTFVVNFLIVAFVLFLVVQAMNRMKATVVKEEAAAPPKAPPAKYRPFDGDPRSPEEITGPRKARRLLALAHGRDAAASFVLLSGIASRYSRQ